MQKLLLVENCLTFVPLALVDQNREIESFKKIWPKLWRFLTILKKLSWILNLTPVSDKKIAWLDWIVKPKRHSWCFSLNQKCNIWFNYWWKNAKHHIIVSKHSSLKVVFWAFSNIGHFKDFEKSSKVFELMTSALDNIKCHVIFFNAARAKMWYCGSFVKLSFYFHPLELVHCVYTTLCLSVDQTRNSLYWSDGPSFRRSVGSMDLRFLFLHYCSCQTMPLANPLCSPRGSAQDK